MSKRERDGDGDDGAGAGAAADGTAPPATADDSSSAAAAAAEAAAAARREEVFDSVLCRLLDVGFAPDIVRACAQRSSVWHDAEARSRLARAHYGARARTQLMAAAALGHAGRARQLLSLRGADRLRDARDAKGSSALHWAAWAGADKIIALVLDSCGAAGVAAMLESRGYAQCTALDFAAAKGHVSTVRLLLARGAAPGALSRDGKSALMHASTCGFVEVVRILADAGAPVELHGGTQRMTPLLLAAANSHAAVVAELLRRGADASATSRTSETPLILAAAAGCVEAVEFLLMAPSPAMAAAGGDGKRSEGALAGAGPPRLPTLQEIESRSTARAANGETALARACVLGHVAVVRRLLDLAPARPQTELKDSEGLAPIHRAAWNSHCEVIEALLDRGADIEAVNRNGNTPMARAAFVGHVRVIDLLAARGAALDARNLDGETPLGRAAAAGRVEAAVKLLALGAALEAVNNDGDSPLHQAALAGKADMVAALLARGASTVSINKRGNAALSLACCSGSFTAVGLLLDAGADVAAVNKSGDSPLALASWLGKTKVVELLLERGANVNTAIGDGRTPLMLASERGYEDVVFKLCQQAMLNVNAVDAQGNTALLKAVRGGHMSIAVALLEAGADKSVVNKRGRAALDEALLLRNAPLAAALRADEQQSPVSPPPAS